MSPLSSLPFQDHLPNLTTNLKISVLEDLNSDFAESLPSVTTEQLATAGCLPIISLQLKDLCVSEDLNNDHTE